MLFVSMIMCEVPNLVSTSSLSSNAAEDGELVAMIRLVTDLRSKGS